MVINSNQIKLSSAISNAHHIEKIKWIFEDYIDDKSIPYYIHSGGDLYDVGGSEIQTLDSSEYKDFIVEIFTAIDELIDLDFVLWDHNDGSLIDIYSTQHDGSEIIGRTILRKGWIDVDFKIIPETWDNKITILHEIGHALGLSHPNGNGFDINYSVEDTLMSYNNHDLGKPDWFTSTDIYTLTEIWGKESDIVYNQDVIIYPLSTENSISTFSVEENNLIINTFTANKDVFWSITGGEDASKFNIDSKNGTLSFIEGPDYEIPDDADKNNIYLLEIRATDFAEDSLTQGISIKVTDDIKEDPITGQLFNLDVDGDGKVTAFGDGLMVIRKLFGSAFAGDALTAKAISDDATRNTNQIHEYIQLAMNSSEFYIAPNSSNSYDIKKSHTLGADAFGPFATVDAAKADANANKYSWFDTSGTSTLDVDGDGKVTAFGDGLMVIRKLFGSAFAGDALTAKVISANATRDTDEIHDYIAAMTTVDPIG